MMGAKMNSKLKILTGILVVVIIFFSGLFILEQNTTKPIEKPVSSGEIFDGLQLTIEPVDGLINEMGVYIFRKNRPFKIKVTLDNRGEESAILLSSNRQTVYDKVLYFQILNVNGTILKTESRVIDLFSVAAVGPERIVLQSGEKQSFFTYLNSKERGIEHHHFTESIMEGSILEYLLGERYYRIRGIYDTTGYRTHKNYEDIHEVLFYSNDIMIEVVEDFDLCSPKNPWEL
jgi:hypothetical protein